MASTPSCTCLCDSPDSPLSTTSSIISIVTLVYVVLVGVLFQCAVHQRAKTQSSALYKDARTLRQKINELRDPSSQQTPANDMPVAALLTTADDELIRMERSLSFGPRNEEMPQEKWYLIWRQVEHARRREAAERSLATLQRRVEFYENYRYVMNNSLTTCNHSCILPQRIGRSRRWFRAAMQPKPRRTGTDEGFCGL